MRPLLALTLGLGLLSSACIVVPRHHHLRLAPRHTRSAVHGAVPACAPGHSWDGARCRHKGQGHGARKHDY